MSGEHLTKGNNKSGGLSFFVSVLSPPPRLRPLKNEPLSFSSSSVTTSNRQKTTQNNTWDMDWNLELRRIHDTWPLPSPIGLRHLQAEATVQPPTTPHLLCLPKKTSKSEFKRESWIESSSSSSLGLFSLVWDSGGGPWPSHVRSRLCSQLVSKCKESLSRKVYSYTYFTSIFFCQFT